MNKPRFSRPATALLSVAALLALFTFMLFTLIRPAAAVNCSVPSASYTTIQSAIDDMACDTVLIDAGSYSENLTVGRSLTLQSSGSSQPLIDGTRSGRVLTIDGSGIVVTLNNLRISGGDATGESVNGRNGGGILVTNGATLHADGLQIDDNIASTAAQTGFGGGVAIDDSSAYISNTLVYSNTASRRSGTFTGGGQGGGLYVNGTAYLSLAYSDIMTNTAAYRANNIASGGGLLQNGDSTVELSYNSWQGNVARGENSAACSACTPTDGSGHGGAVSVLVATTTAVLNVTGDQFVGNIANASNDNYDTNEVAGGGAISLMATNTAGQITGTVRQAHLYNNIAKAGSGDGEGRGGAIHARGATLIVHRSTMLHNEAALADEGYGGGIYIREPDTGDYLDIVNSVLAGNNALGVGGNGAQVYINYVGGSTNSATLTHVTLADSMLNPKQALHYNGTSVGDQLAITNAIIANHEDGIFNVNATGWATATYLLFSGNTNNYAAGSVAFPDTSTHIDGNADFVDTANDDYHLGSSSDAIDAGTDAGVTVDRDGQQRPFPSGGAFDIGAYEWPYFQYKLYLPIVLK